MEGDEACPAEWERTSVRGDEVSFRHESGEISVAAMKTHLAGSETEWELSIEHETADSTVAESFGRVSDRETAVGALQSCMKAIDVALSTEDGVPEQMTVREMQLDDIVTS